MPLHVYFGNYFIKSIVAQVSDEAHGPPIDFIPENMVWNFATVCNDHSNIIVFARRSAEKTEWYLKEVGSVCTHKTHVNRYLREPITYRHDNTLLLVSRFKQFYHVSSPKITNKKKTFTSTRNFLFSLLFLKNGQNPFSLINEKLYSLNKPPLLWGLENSFYKCMWVFVCFYYERRIVSLNINHLSYN